MKVVSKQNIQALQESISLIIREDSDEIQKLFTNKNQNHYIRVLNGILDSFDPCEMENEEDVYLLLQSFGCPYDPKKIFNPLGAPNTWPHAVLILDWAVNLALTYVNIEEGS